VINGGLAQYPDSPKKKNYQNPIDPDQDFNHDYYQDEIF